MHVHSTVGIGKVAVAAVLIIVVALSGLGYVIYEQTAVKPNTVTLALDFSPNSADAPLYYGLSQGIYQQNGINLTILPGTSVYNAVVSLEAGQVDFAKIDPSSLVAFKAASNFTDIRVVALTYERSQVAVIYNNATISNVSDLEGKSGSMLGPSQGDIWGYFQLFASANGLNTSSMNIQYNTPSTSFGLLVTGKVQFIVSVVQVFATLEGTAASNGVHLGYFPLADHGLPSAGVGIATTQKMIDEQPAIVTSFVKATMESFVDAYSNQAAAVGDLVKLNPQLNETTSLVGFQELLACCAVNPSNLTDPLQYGWMDPHFMQQTVNTEIAAANLGISLDATLIYTNAFVKQP